ncbi:putative BEL1-like homeodomain 8 [Hibiscus syriacus]|uniref:BEL1-like homeodomain 8 n=1 Tax=Hibiscus syriacus TaxID=106335 RepID=A0A6A2YAL2_HIBSY|nr:putative BEL1-like homeodomain 8 [Hibiscus syriacus]
MGARMRLLALALTILVMMSSCSAAKVLKVDSPKPEHIIFVGRRLLVDDAKSGNREESGVNNHHYIPREDFSNYPGGDGSAGSG